MPTPRSAQVLFHDSSTPCIYTTEEISIPIDLIRGPATLRPRKYPSFPFWESPEWAVLASKTVFHWQTSFASSCSDLHISEPLYSAARNASPVSPRPPPLPSFLERNSFVAPRDEASRETSYLPLLFRFSSCVPPVLGSTTDLFLRIRQNFEGLGLGLLSNSWLSSESLPGACGNKNSPVLDFV